MARTQRMFRKGEVIELDITDLAYGGKGMAKIPTEKGDFAVFVQNTFPGQKVAARVIKCKSRHAECKLDQVLVRAPEEVQNDFQTIPGAPYAQVPIEIQREFKKNTTLELFKRIGGVADIEARFDTYIESPKTWHYRNKMEYSFSQIRFDLKEEKEYDDFGLGFKHRGTWWSVEDLDADSGLFDPQFESELHCIRKFLLDTQLPAWHPPKREGFYRFLVARKSYAQDQIILNLVTSSSHVDEFDREGFVALLKELLGKRLAGVVHTVNDDRGERVESRDGIPTLLYGRDFVTEEILGLKFDISLSSFFQTNPGSAERLYAKAIDYAVQNADEGHVFMDLFCGTGTITQLLAKHVKTEVVGVDIVASAIENARSSAQNNGVENAVFFADDAGKFLLNHPEYSGKIGTVMLDPPRSGIAPKTLRKVIRLNSQKIVYISCNPATQARDTAVLHEAGYTLKKLSLCDQFPHTAHIESIAWFEK